VARVLARSYRTRKRGISNVKGDYGFGRHDAPMAIAGGPGAIAKVSAIQRAYAVALCGARAAPSCRPVAVLLIAGRGYAALGTRNGKYPSRSRKAMSNAGAGSQDLWVATEHMTGDPPSH
jgi:hypothetical protein